MSLGAFRPWLLVVVVKPSWLILSGENAIADKHPLDLDNIWTSWTIVIF